MFKIIKSGGWIMLPIFLCAFAATFIIIERILYFADLKKETAFCFKWYVRLSETAILYRRKICVLKMERLHPPYCIS